MQTREKEETQGEQIEIEVTDCPECGTEWEVVVTERPTASKPRNRREG